MGGIIMPDIVLSSLIFYLSHCNLSSLCIIGEYPDYTSKRGPAEGPEGMEPDS